VANLYDFDPATHALPTGELEAIDRFALARYGEAAGRIRRAYDAFDFSAVTQALNTLATVDLSAFYVDVTKDRMYTLGPSSCARRSTQTAMYVICDGLARLLAPILPVTADDLWRHLPGPREASVHLADFPETEGLVDRGLLETWGRLMEVREQVNAALEEQRKAKVIGTSLGARVSLRVEGPLAALLEAHRAELPMLFNVSDVVLSAGDAAAAPRLEVAVEKAPGVKCARCWRIVAAVRAEPAWEGICGRCVEALGGPVT
jgi:isoleucyl-tRNA synthetase